jgi:membrane-associated HD superfamily phosphohydrolase
LGGFAVAPPQSRLVMLVCALFASTAAPQRCCVRTHRHILRLTATLNCFALRTVGITVFCVWCRSRMIRPSNTWELLMIATGHQVTRTRSGRFSHFFEDAVSKTRFWWVLLITGAAWIIGSILILRLDYTTVTAIAVLFVLSGRRAQ